MSATRSWISLWWAATCSIRHLIALYSSARCENSCRIAFSRCPMDSNTPWRDLTAAVSDWVALGSSSANTVAPLTASKSRPLHPPSPTPSSERRGVSDSPKPLGLKGRTIRASTAPESKVSVSLASVSGAGLVGERRAVSASSTSVQSSGTVSSGSPSGFSAGLLNLTPVTTRALSASQCNRSKTASPQPCFNRTGEMVSTPATPRARHSWSKNAQAAFRSLYAVVVDEAGRPQTSSNHVVIACKCSNCPAPMSMEKDVGVSGATPLGTQHKAR
mmetsp:Transcript_35206/g.80344  ORF Transcript_35206/g.80344 Transcript_35206/m.80344 type:complete len:274 (-) Transcript_35206:1163-1984(-)